MCWHTGTRSEFITRARRAILTVLLLLEGWPSGLRRTLGKRVYGKPYRGFESHSLRQKILKYPDYLPVCFPAIAPTDVCSHASRSPHARGKGGRERRVFCKK